MADMAYIADFLKRVEGSFTRLYIPCFLRSGGSANYFGGPNPGNYIAMGASGCTVGVGCDLGQTDAATLQSYGCPEDIIRVFTPYYGKRKDAAVRILHEKPLTVSQEVADGLTLAVHEGYLARNVRPAYDKKSSVKFDNLPKQAQAVVMSICYQKGVGGVQRDYPKTWKYLTAQDWVRASRELKTGFVQYKSRRRIEGELLGELL